MNMGWTLFFLIPVACGAVYWMATTITLAIFFSKKKKPPVLASPWPSVSLIKPVCGLEKNLEANLKTALGQDYPDYEVIYVVQDKNDPALPVLEKIRGAQIVIDEEAPGPNGRLVNICNGAKRAAGEILVFSDSDMFLEPDYLKMIVAPFLEDSKGGMVCTLYRAAGAVRWFEKLELLSLNADFIPSAVFAEVTGLSKICPGSSQAIRRDVLEKIGGLAPLAHYLVEDFELGQRVQEAGFQIKIIHYLAQTQVALHGVRDWWRHQVYWKQNTRAAAPVGFFFTLLIRAVPFSLLYALLGGVAGRGVLGITLGLRWVTSVWNALILRDREGLKALWLLPLRDLLGFFVWIASLTRHKTHWRGKVFRVKKGIMHEATGG
ncbi:MAG: glycosyltransferase [Deltaproteobacteria bacterium]|nr:glycosyltransferase [Deltaproteobacteria bacterium]